MLLSDHHLGDQRIFFNLTLLIICIFALNIDSRTLIFKINSNKFLFIAHVQICLVQFANSMGLTSHVVLISESRILLFISEDRF